MNHNNLFQEFQAFFGDFDCLVANQQILAAKVETMATQIEVLSKSVLNVNEWIGKMAPTVEVKPEIKPIIEPSPTPDDMLLRVLEVIKTKGPRLTLISIGDWVGLSDCTVHGLVTKLHAKGWILKGRGEYRLTERGKKRLKDEMTKAEKPQSAPRQSNESVMTEAQSEISALAIIASSCDCKVKDQRGRDFLRHIVTTDKVTYETLMKALGQTGMGTISGYLKRFFSNDVVKREKLSHHNYKYSVNVDALNSHDEKCAKAPQPKLVASEPSNAILDRANFVHHMRTYGKVKGHSEAQNQEMFHFIYGVMASTGHDPRGKRDTATDKKLKPVDYLEKSGLAGEALKLAREHFPLPA